MATLYNTKISATYPGLIKTTDNAALTATLKELTDGSGNASGLYVNNAGDFKVNAILEWGSLKDTGTGVTITQWVTAADGIENFNNDTSVPTSAAVKTYVDAVVTASDLDFLGDTNTGTPAVDLDSQNFSIIGTANEIETSGAAQTLTIGLPTSVTISDTFTGATFVGDLNGTINTLTTATTQTAGNNSTKVATTAYVDTLDAASDLDFTGDSGTGDVNLNTQSLAITGTTNQIVTAAVHQGLSLSLPATVHRDLQGNVTGNVQGDLTGNITATSILADGVTATTQASSDSSAKIATTAYVKGLDNASDLDITGDSGTGDVNLNTQTLNILGTTNEITTAVVNQTATISLPSSISVDVIGNVTGDLTGNADTATTWETARDLSLTGQATATLSNVDGALAVSGAVTLDNNSVTAKVLTGLPTPAAASVLATDSIVEGIGKLQSQINGLAGGLRFMGSWDADTNSPVLSSGGGEATNGTTTSTSTNKLIDSAANFTATVTVGDQVVNQVDGQTALVTNVDSSTILSIDADIMLSGETYTIDNTPFLTQGHYYVVSVGGTTSLNGVSNWSVGDWVIAGANNEWTQLDHTDVEGTGTAGNIAKWSATGTIADSIMAESGAAITVTGTLSTTTNLNSGSNFAVATNKFTANATTGAVAFEGGLAINTDKFTVNATSGNTLVAGTLDVTDTLIVNKSASAAVEIAQFKVDGTGGTNGNFSYVSILPGSGNFATQLRLHTNNTGSAYQSISNNVGVLELATNNSNPMVFKTNSVTRLTISNTGNATFTGTISGVGILSDGSTAITQSAADASTKVATTAYADAAATAVPIGNYLPLAAGTSYPLTDSLLVNVNANNKGIQLANSFALDNASTFLYLAGKNTAGTFKTGQLELLHDGSLNLRCGGSGTTTAYGNIALTLDTSQNATFAGNVDIYKTTDSQLQIESLNEDATIIINSGADGVGGANREEGFIKFYQNNADFFTLGKKNNGQFVLTDHSAGQDVITFQDSGGILLTPANNLVDVTGSLTLRTNASFYSTRTYLGDAYTFGSTETADGVSYTINGAAAGTAGNYFRWLTQAGAATPVERMRIDSSGNVGIGGTLANKKLYVLGDTTNYQILAEQPSGYAGLSIKSTTLAQTWSWIANDNGSNSDLLLYGGAAAGVKLTINSSGNSTFAGSITTTSTSGVISPLGVFSTASLNTNVFRFIKTGNVGYNWQFPATDSIRFGPDTGSDKKLSFTNTGGGNFLVGIGTDSPDYKLEVSGSIATNVTENVCRIEGGTWLNSGGITIESTGASSASDRVTTIYSIDNQNQDAPLAFGTGTTERLRITSGGDLFVGTDSTLLSGARLVSSFTGNINNGLLIEDTISTGTANMVVFTRNGVQTGAIEATSSATAYVTSSDYRLKEDLKDFNGLDKVSKIPVYDFKWKVDENRSYGVMAHELQKVLPQAVTGEKDAEKMQQVDYSKIVPLLVKSIQELTAKVEMLENKCQCKN